MLNFQGVVKMGIFPKKVVIFLKPPASFFNISIPLDFERNPKNHLKAPVRCYPPKQQSQKHQEKSIQFSSQGQPPGMYKTFINTGTSTTSTG